MKITPEMVAAGRRALDNRPKQGAITRELVCQVWKAMAAACPPIKVPLPEGITPAFMVIRLE